MEEEIIGQPAIHGLAETRKQRGMLNAGKRNELLLIQQHQYTEQVIFEANRPGPECSLRGTNSFFQWEKVCSHGKQLREILAAQEHVNPRPAHVGAQPERAAFEPTYLPLTFPLPSTYPYSTRYLLKKGIPGARSAWVQQPCRRPARTALLH